MTAAQRAFDLAALDMAGTTLDEAGLVYEVLDATVRDAVGAPVPPELLADWKGTSKRKAIAGLFAALGADASDPAADKTYADFTARLVEAYRATPPTPFPGLLEVFDALRAAGARLALQTGYSAEIAESILESLDWQLGTSDVVDTVITSDLVPASRPAPCLVFRCMEATGVTNVRRVLVAGDTPNDLVAGVNAGAGFVVGVLTGSFSAAALGRERHTHLLSSVAELPTLL